jgi:hypothetical protein
LMIDGLPPCVSDGKPPSRLTASGYDHDGSLIGRCPGPDLVVPTILVQPRFDLTVTIVDDALDARVSFSSSAWVEEYLEGAAVVQTCVLTVSSLAPSTTALAGAVAAWQVVYGDPITGAVSGCGLYAQVGALTGETPADLVYANNFDSRTCPTTLLNAPGLMTLRDYFTVVPQSQSSGLSGGAIAAIVCGVAAAVIAAGVAARAAWLRSKGPAFSRVYDVDGDGPAPDAPASAFTAVSADGEEEEVTCSPVVAATNMAKDAVQGARRAMSFSVQ